MPIDHPRNAGRTATVVGGGPGGLMAAHVLAHAGVSATVYEHMPSAGRKLVLAGRSGLNLTHAEPTDALVTRYGAAEPRLAAAIRAFPADALRALAADLGQPTFIGSSGRVFPVAMRATPLLRAWLAHLELVGVRIETGRRWLGWATGPDGRLRPTRSRFEHASGRVTEVDADVTVLALGGGSWPRVGSDGRWTAAMREARVTVHDLRPANCGVRVAWSPTFRERFGGVPLTNAGVTVGRDTRRGGVMVTNAGLEGSPIYALVSNVRDELDRAGRCVVHLDLHPDLSRDTVAARLLRRRAKESSANRLRRCLGLAPVAIGLLREARGGPLPTDAGELAELVKAVPLIVDGLMPLDRAISTSGGLALDEVDDSFMLRRLPGVFVAGEMLDWEAPTGGYLLQATFSTAVAAANGALDWLASQP